MTQDSKQTPLLPAYLIAGEDDLKRATVLSRLRERMAKMGDLSFNSETFMGSSCTGEEIVTAANTLPFASPVRLVEVHEIDKLKIQCPACGSTDLKLLTGHEFYVESLEVD